MSEGAFALRNNEPMRCFFHDFVRKHGDAKSPETLDL